MVNWFKLWTQLHSPEAAAIGGKSGGAINSRWAMLRGLILGIPEAVAGLYRLTCYGYLP